MKIEGLGDRLAQTGLAPITDCEIDKVLVVGSRIALSWGMRAGTRFRRRPTHDREDAHIRYSVGFTCTACGRRGADVRPDWQTGRQLCPSIRQIGSVRAM